MLVRQVIRLFVGCSAVGFAVHFLLFPLWIVRAAVLVFEYPESLCCFSAEYGGTLLSPCGLLLLVPSDPLASRAVLKWRVSVGRHTHLPAPRSTNDA